MDNLKSEQLGSLEITGPDAFKLLQGQLSCDLNKLSNDGGYGAHCNPKGRVISFFYLQKNKDGYSLIMPGDILEIAKNALEKYAVFYKVNLTIKEHGRPNETQNKLFDIEKGIPSIHQETSEIFLPHELNLNKLNAISYDKGCFTGQEIIARMEYRGKLKKQIVLACIKSDLAVCRGDDIHDESGEVIAKLIDFNTSDTNTYLALILSKESTLNNTEIKLQNGSEMTIRKFK